MANPDLELDVFSPHNNHQKTGVFSVQEELLK